MKVKFSGHIFEKLSYFKLHENRTSRSRVVPCGRAGRQTDMTRLIVDFRNSANAPRSSQAPDIYTHLKSHPNENVCFEKKGMLEEKRIVYMVALNLTE
jgi:hypothetical protein